MDLLKKIEEAGVIGAGGAGFPTHVKLNSKAEYLLMNGAECEPLLRVDQQLMGVFPKEIIRGFVAAKQITGAEHAIIGIKGKHWDVIDILEKTLETCGLSDQIKIGILPDVYPAGDEQVLVYELTGRIVPETGIPLAVGCVVMNTETVLNIYHAMNEQPVTEKYVTIAGDVKTPVTVKVPVGTPVRELFDIAGLRDDQIYEIIDGGPMMGPILNDRDGYVTKKTKGLVILPKEHGLIQKKKREMRQVLRINRSACEQCRMCTDLCPRHLLGHSTSPHKMVRAMAYGRSADETMSVALTCCQCNLCEYFSCPAGISPRMANVYYMQQLRSAGIRHEPKKSFEANEMRRYRIVPSKRLIARLGLSEFDVKAPLQLNPDIRSEIFGYVLNGHVGVPAKAIVQAGNQITAGEKIAEIPSGALGACVHASVSGVVESVEENLIRIRRDRCE